MDVRRYESPAEFASVVRWVYRRNPVHFTSELTALRQSPWPRGRILASAHRVGVVGAAVQGGDGCLFVGGLSVRLAKDVAVELAADEIASVRGHRSSAAAFADAWRGATGRRAVETRVDVLHRLDVLRRPTGVAGEARPLVGGDHGLVTTWLDGFFADVFGEPADPPARADYLRDVLAANGRVVLWTVDGVAVSMARVHAPAVGVSRIGPVYTPPEHRGHGYAAAVTAAAVDDAHHRGARDVVLFADAANPVSTGVYRRIGFEPVAEHVCLDLVPVAAPTRRNPQVSGPPVEVVPAGTVNPCADRRYLVRRPSRG